MRKPKEKAKRLSNMTETQETDGRHARLLSAKKARNDEFYTLYESISDEVPHYKGAFVGKHVLCPCDDYRHSEFARFFRERFSDLGLSRLTVSNFDIGEGAWVYTFDGVSETAERADGNGSFDSEQGKRLMSECDVVVTNPPFSLIRGFAVQTDRLAKQFLYVGPYNLATYKNTFPLFRDGRMWVGCTSPKKFLVPEHDPSNRDQRIDPVTGDVYQRFHGNVVWFTNMEHDMTGRRLDTNAVFDPSVNRRYYNADAVDCPSLDKIPSDYDGLMGVPVSFLSVYNPGQFELVGVRHGDDGKDLTIGGKTKFARILIRKKK